MSKDKGWDYLNSDDVNDTFNSEDDNDSWSYKNETGSGSYYGADDNATYYDSEDEDGEDESTDSSDLISDLVGLAFTLGGAAMLDGRWVHLLTIITLNSLWICFRKQPA